MNMFFWLLVIIAAVILWFTLRGAFNCTGKYINRVLDDTKEIMLSENKEIKEETEEKGD